MAFYHKLLLSAGGGIISQAQQAQQSGTAAILVGLGGTGISCLRTIKGAVYERLSPDDPDADIPEYRHIEFIAVDSDRSVLDHPDGAIHTISDTEFFQITRDYCAAAMQTAAEPLRSWLRNQEIDVPAMAAGAGGNRQIGRCFMLAQSFDFINQLIIAIRQAKEGLDHASVSIHIFAGLSGGTGSGAFLDVCYMARRALELAGDKDSGIFGYFFLPDVNLSRIHDPAVRAYIPENGYAALKELDHCMQFGKNGGSFVQFYQNGWVITWDRPPVDLCHLIGAANAGGTIQPDAYAYAMNVVSEHVMEHLISGSPMVPMQHNADNPYLMLGAASARIPYKEIHTYLASALFSRFSSVVSRVPTEQEVTDLVDELGLSYKALCRTVRSAAGGDFTLNGMTAKEVRQFGTRAIEQYYEKEQDDMMGRIKDRFPALLDEKNPYSLIKRLRDALDRRIRDINCGPIFVSRMLSGAQEHNLLRVIDGLICCNKERMDCGHQRLEHLRNAWQKCHADLLPRLHSFTGLLNGNAIVAEYKNALLDLHMHEVEMEVYRQVDRLLVEFRRQVTDVRDNFYSVFARLMGNLVDTFEQNAAVLNAFIPAPYVMPLLTMRQLRDELDARVNQIDLNGALSQFMGYLLANSSVWLSGDESKIAKLVSKFFLDDVFADYSVRTIMSYLESLYGTTDVDILQQKIYLDYMVPLLQEALLLCGNRNHGFSIEVKGSIYWGSVPMNADAIVGAGEMLAKKIGIRVRRTALSDGIQIMRCCPARIVLHPEHE